MTFPAGLATITVTGQHILSLDGQPLDGAVIFIASGPLDDPAADAMLSGSAVAVVSEGVMTPITIPATDAVSPPFTYDIAFRLDSADGTSPPPYPGISIPSTLGPTVDISALLR
jgi:hypothetical protein